MPSLFEGSDGARFQSWEGFANARSLEGIPTATGVVQSGRLFRSDLPSCSAEGFEAIVVQADLTLVLDLRSEDEVVQNPSVLTGHPVYQVTPLIDPTMDHLRDPSAERDLVDLYRGSIDRNGRTIAQAVRRIALAPDGGILIHCAAGKDRTGLLVAVLLAALGTPDEPIIADYAATQGRLDAYFAAQLAALSDPARQSRLQQLQHASPDTMAALLQHLRDRHGGGHQYLATHGLTIDEFDTVRYRLTEPKAEANTTS